MPGGQIWWIRAVVWSFAERAPVFSFSSVVVVVREERGGPGLKDGWCRRTTRRIEFVTVSAAIIGRDGWPCNAIGSLPFRSMAPASLRGVTVCPASALDGFTRRSSHRLCHVLTTPPGRNSPHIRDNYDVHLAGQWYAQPWDQHDKSSHCLLLPSSAMMPFIISMDKSTQPQRQQNWSKIIPCSLILYETRMKNVMMCAEVIR